MILNRERRTKEIKSCIQQRIHDINKIYRNGPSFYFYKKVVEYRNSEKNLNRLLSNNYFLELTYATLASWDMNTRGAKMNSFDFFKENLGDNLINFNSLDKFYQMNIVRFDSEFREILKRTYNGLYFMISSKKLVSNSKLLHYLFPNLLMPIDGNSLLFFYKGTNESTNKYIEIIEFSFELINQLTYKNRYLDNKWNTSFPKLIDNAIILLRKKNNK